MLGLILKEKSFNSRIACCEDAKMRWKAPTRHVGCQRQHRLKHGQILEQKARVPLPQSQFDLSHREVLVAYSWINCSRIVHNFDFALTRGSARCFGSSSKHPLLLSLAPSVQFWSWLNNAMGERLDQFSWEMGPMQLSWDWFLGDSDLSVGSWPGGLTCSANGILPAGYFSWHVLWARGLTRRRFGVVVSNSH